MGLANTTDNLSYARNELIKVGTSFIFDKVGDMIYYMLANNDISGTDPFVMGSDGAGEDVTFYGDLASNWFKWDADTYFLHLDGTGTTMRIGDFNGATADSGIALTSSRTGALKVFADDNDTDIGSGTLARAIWGRFLSTTGSQNAELAGVQGSVVVSTGEIIHNAGGVWGSLEARGTSSFNGTAGQNFFAAVMGRVGCGEGATLDIKTGAVCAGLAGISNMYTATVTQTGVTAGVYVGAWPDADDWDYGLYIANKVGVAIFIADTNKIEFYDTGVYIQASADNKLKLSADGTGADDITLSGTLTLDDQITAACTHSSAAAFTHQANTLTISAGSSAGQSIIGMHITTATVNAAPMNIGNLMGLRVDAKTLDAADDVVGLFCAAFLAIDQCDSQSDGYAYPLFLKADDSSSGSRANRPEAWIGMADAGYAGTYPMYHLFDIGGSAAACPTGSNKLFDTTTLRIHVNLVDKYIPLSTATNAFTTAAVISTSNTTESDGVAAGSIYTSGGLGVTGKAYIGKELFLVAGPIDMTTAASDIEIKADTEAALEIKGAAAVLTFDTRTGTSGVTAFAFAVPAADFTAVSGSTRPGVSITPGTTTFGAGTVTVTAMEGLGLYISQPTIAGTASTVTDASTVYIAAAPVKSGDVAAITNAYALKIAAGDSYFGGTIYPYDTAIGIDLVNCALTVTGRDTAYISMGNYSDHITLDLSGVGSGDRFYGMQMYLDSTTNTSAGTWFYAIRPEITVNGENQTNTNFSGLVPTFVIEKNIASVRCVMAQLEIGHADVTAISAGCSAVSGYVNLGTETKNLDASGTCCIAAVIGDIENGKSLTLTGAVTRVFAVAGNIYTNASATGALLARVDGSGILTSALVTLENSVGATVPFAFNFHAGDWGHWITTTHTHNTAGEEITVQVMGNTRYIRTWKT